jgi:hypothetical protein
MHAGQLSLTKMLRGQSCAASAASQQLCSRSSVVPTTELLRESTRMTGSLRGISQAKIKIVHLSWLTLSVSVSPC